MADNLVSKSVAGKTNGKRSSEYWLSLLGTVGSIAITLAEVFVGSGNQWVMLAAAALGVFCPASYSASRAPRRPLGSAITPRLRRPPDSGT